MKLKNSNCDETQKIKFWWNSRNQMVIKLKNINCDKTQKLKLWPNFKKKNSNCDKAKNVIGTKLKKSNCEKIIELWQNLSCDKTQIVSKLKKSKFEKKSNCDKTQKLHLKQNSKTQIVTKLKKTKIVTKLELWQISIYEI